MVVETGAVSARVAKTPRLLILGTGFGGVYALRRLVGLVKDGELDITLIGEENLFVFSPLLHEVATGALEPRHVATPVRRLPRPDRFSFVHAPVEHIDLRNRRVLTGKGTLNYDYLILALGSTRDISSLKNEGGKVFTLKTITDARQIKNQIIEVFEQAASEKDAARQKELLTFVISGGGYIGVQLIAALQDFIFRDLLKGYSMIDRKNVRLVLVEITPKIIPTMHTKLGAYAMKHLRETGIEVRLKSEVTATYADHVVINDAELVPCRTLIWVAGLLCNPCIAETVAGKDPIGRVYVNDYLQLLDFPEVYAVGDCAHFAHPKTGRPIPPKAHTGVRQAKRAAGNILADVRGEQKRPYNYSNPFEVIPLGPSRGVFSFHSLRIYGILARFLWMAGYATLAPNFYNRVRITSDWILSVIFGRDMSLLK
jgi:NADH dehydrogenase